LPNYYSLSNYYSFQMQAGHYSCKKLTLEMVLTNTLSMAVQLVPAPLLVDYFMITTGLSAILQTLYSEELWGYLAMSSKNVKMRAIRTLLKPLPPPSSPQAL